MLQNKIKKNSYKKLIWRMLYVNYEVQHLMTKNIRLHM